MKRYWRHGLVVLIGIVILVGLQWLGAMVLPESLGTAELLTTPTPAAMPTLVVTATPSATPTMTITPTPAPTMTNAWPQLVVNPLDYSVVVNKKYVLAASFVPPDLRSVGVPHTNNHPLRDVAATALEQMVATAASQNVQLRLLSGYRSYATQASLYNSYVKNDGQAAADRYSARPGHSEHQLGLALDIGDADTPSCDVKACFGSTTAGQWIAAHAADFGYVIRYAANKEAITGYMAEPWHIRFVGIELAKTLVSNGQTLEEYFGLAGGGY